MPWRWERLGDERHKNERKIEEGATWNIENEKTEYTYTHKKKKEK
jgi:hypothetical protein